MKTRLLFSCVLLCLFAVHIHAEVLSPEAALKRVENSNSSQARYLRQPAAASGAEYSAAPILTIKDALQKPALYLFAAKTGEGFLIASADDCAEPVLGYSDSGNINAASLPPQLKWWLDRYASEIGAIRENTINKEVASGNSLSFPSGEIAPLLKSKWNQGTPYDKYTYYLKSDTDSVKSVTGCVATAMAQIMYYYQYPSVGTGEISYTHGSSGTYSMNFGAKPFDWKDMRPTYYPGTYTEAEGDAVAYLMKACGYSVKMDYGLGESGASGTAPATALTEYFGYSDAISVQSREWWSYDEWVEMIYKNLSEVGPLIYNGSALDGGHSFVCDGYDGNGYFHFNWGWGGMADGYYLLDALNPDEYGIGGAAGGYNLGQQIVIGITPDVDATQPSRLLMQFGNLKGDIADHTLSLELTESDNPGMQYIDPEEVTVGFGLMVENTTDENQEIQYFKSDKTETAKMGSFFHWDEVGLKLDLDKVKMTQGDAYDIYIATNINSEWNPVVAQPGHYNYVTVTKTDSGYEITNHSEVDLAVSNFKVETETVYQDMPIEFSATFSNSSEWQLSRNYSAAFFDSSGKEQYKTENAGVTVDTLSSINHVWTSVQWYTENDAEAVTEPTEFTVKLYDNWTGQYVEGAETTVTVNPEPKDKKVEANLSLEGVTEENGEYTIKGTDFVVTITIKVESGYFSAPINLDIEVPQSEGYYSIQSQRFDAIPSLSAGEEQTLTMSMKIEDPVLGQRYRLQAWSGGDTLGSPLTVNFTDLSTGVNILPDVQGHYRIYTLDGLQVLDTDDADAIGTLPAGFYIVNGKKLLKTD